MNKVVDPRTLGQAKSTVPVPVPVTIAYGDGIGPEIMEACLRILDEAGAAIAPEIIQVGEEVYRAGNTAGIGPEAWDSLRRTKVLYKAPITTPSGGGYKSLNVTIRKRLGLFANVRPCRAYAPFVSTLHPDMDVIIVRENEEDLYAGIEHRQTDDVVQCLKLVSRTGCQRVIRHAFELARANGRRKVTCLTKDNIMKMTDGLFHQVFDEIGREYPEIEKDHMIIDIGAARLATDPARFDVIVTLNLYGDILSDIAAELAGSVGLAPSANIGREAAMFEAVHGSAPDIAGQGIANPSGLLLAGVMMLVHIGQGRVAERVHNAWLAAIEDGLGTADMDPKRLLTTDEFAHAIIARLGQKPLRLKPVSYSGRVRLAVQPEAQPKPAAKTLVGVDVFVHRADIAPVALANALNKVAGDALILTLVTNRGVKVWPDGIPETNLSDHWRCRFLARPGVPLNKALIAQMLLGFARAGIDFVKTEHLFDFDGKPGYSLGQGQ